MSIKHVRKVDCTMHACAPIHRQGSMATFVGNRQRNVQSCYIIALSARSFHVCAECECEHMIKKRFE